MHPSGRTATDLNEYPLSLVDLREDGGSPSENRENGFVGRRSRAKVDTGATNDPSTSVARHDLGLVEDRLGNASRAIDNKECRAKATFVDLALRFDELDSRILDFGVPPRRTRRCAFDLDACRRQRRDGVGAGMATRQPRLGLDECGLRGLKIRLKSRNLLHQLRSALGLGFTKALRLFDIDAELIRFGSAG